MESGHLKPEWDEEISIADFRTISDPYAITRICMGLAWEEWYIREQLPTVIDHPGEMQVEGIYMTPDGEELTTIIVERRNRWVRKIHEVKLTYKSMKTVGWSDSLYDSSISNEAGPLSTQWMWLAQTKGYCYGAGTNYVDLHVLFVCGDYTWPQRPLPRKYSIEFTPTEIQSNWDLMTNYRDYALEKENRRA